ncbi:hypothetical protein [Saccharolobus islandicus]|uniref:Uncharacterized protein n=5 Tax=Saccharolobus islandicus TaxID=43080 RepID=F0ND76_SACI5|nr:hypothetical protein [Sulfolobus islandicus]ACP39155.1 conserved hypothetical protein [Sulfolobus islandicus M.14.25]ACP56355.1 conserved hypothetical protein [Sulfolobus islandicus M.16.27]ACR43031.1 conserved hypothetical protein [Sulfolobus islandicus M.16.4]ADX83712.1 conserved hypothetical protein [Sulfolobus islandicus HVE10/4]ADX86373.1 conserved hypothetical protein [Sulfolobus islandicus REY15A]
MPQQNTERVGLENVRKGAIYFLIYSILNIIASAGVFSNTIVSIPFTFNN